MNMHRNMRALKEVGYEHMCVPDHVPGGGEPDGYRQGFAFAFGYIHAMIQAVMDE
jgi:mannonate dehydratase